MSTQFESPRVTTAEIYTGSTAGPAALSGPPDDYAGFDDIETRNGLQARVEIPLMLWALDVPRGGRVLEVGCGRGVALPVLAAQLEPRELIGIDVDPALVEEATRRTRGAGVERVAVRCADVRALPFERERFDVVIDFGTCYHVGGGIGGKLAAMREIARVLRPGGLFVHETPVAQHLAHPVRSFGRTLPWLAEPALVRERTALLWSARRKRCVSRE